MRTVGTERGQRLILLSSAAVVLAVMFAATGWLLGHGTLPESLEAPHAIESVEITYQDFTDAPTHRRTDA